MESNPRIHIFGASGSGTTTLARAVSAELGCQHIDADDYFWQQTDPPFQKKTQIEERIQRISSDAPDTGAWVLSGCIAEWGDWIKPRLTLSVFVTLNPSTRIDRLLAREQTEFGKRIDVGGDLYDSHRQFIAWATSYDTAAPPVRSAKLHEQWIREMPCQVLRVNSKEPVMNLVKKLIDSAA